MPASRLAVMWNYSLGVMAGLVPAIHVFLAESSEERGGCPATSAGMTIEGLLFPLMKIFATPSPVRTRTRTYVENAAGRFDHGLRPLAACDFDCLEPM